MKPNPEPILRAVHTLNAVPRHRFLGEQPSVRSCVLVGDSLSDIQGAHAAGAPVIGYANRPCKVEAFRGAGAGALATSMRGIAAVLWERFE